ncbi:hypothetical protein [Sporosarcina sp. FA9]|uniref:hypothetical protein n=1 Tax=Sporosarcina sp. FA9 TaxID=3413030 RepID=UPI003F658A06
MDEPFRWHGGLEIYCKEDCLPENVLDEPYALTYTSLLASYKDFVEELSDIETWYRRDELLSGIELCEKQCAEYVFGDLEGLFYKERLSELHQWFTELYDKSAIYLLNWDHYRFETGLVIYWEGIVQYDSKESAVALQAILEKYMNENKLNPMHLKEARFDALTEMESILVFPQKEYYKNGFGQNALQDLYTICVDFFEERSVKKGFDYENCIQFTKLFTCPICNCPEPIEDADVSEEYQVIACNYCYNK